MGACENCGSNYKGNCNCKDPITLVATGPTGATGATGAAGADGTSLIDSIITGYSVSLIGVGSSEVLYTSTIDNTPDPELPTNGDVMRVKGRVRLMATQAFRAYDIKVTIGAVNVLVYLRQAVIQNQYLYFDFEIELKRISANSGVYAAFFKMGMAQGGYINQSTTYSKDLTSSNLFDFAVDFNVSVEVTRYNMSAGGTGALENFDASTNGKLQDFIIEKYLLP